MKGVQQLKQLFETMRGDLAVGSPLQVEAFEASIGVKLPAQLGFLYSNAGEGVFYYKDSQVVLLSLEEIESRLHAAEMDAAILYYFPIMEVIERGADSFADSQATFYCVAGHHDLDGTIVRGDRRSLNMKWGGGANMRFVAHDLDAFVSWFLQCLQRANALGLNELVVDDFTEGIDYSPPILSREKAVRLLDLASENPGLNDSSEVFSLGFHLLEKRALPLLTKYTEFPGFWRFLETYRPEFLEYAPLRSQYEEAVRHVRPIAELAIKELIKRGRKSEFRDDGTLFINTPKVSFPIVIDLLRALQDVKKGEDALEFLMDRIEKAITDLKNPWHK